MLRLGIRPLGRSNPLSLIKCAQSNFNYKIPYNECRLISNKAYQMHFYPSRCKNVSLVVRSFCSNNDTLDPVLFEKVCEETLESLCEYFEEIIESSPSLKSADVSYSSGVLTVNFGNSKGIYVINRQTPNKQIWLSSPTSGPKRYDYYKEGHWIYKHDGVTLHELLQKEISQLIDVPVDFKKCVHSKGT